LNGLDDDFIHRASDPAWVPRSFFDRLNPNTQTDLLGLGTRRVFEGGQKILREGDRETHLVLIERGYVKVTMRDADGRVGVMSIRVPGDLVGELAAMTGYPRSATVAACGAVLAYRISSAAFHAFVERHPRAAQAVTAVVSERLVWANQRRLDLDGLSVTARVARVLGALAQTCGVPGDQGIELAVSLSQDELASMVGASEASVVRAMQALRREALIDTGYRRVTLFSVAKLRAYIEDSRSKTII
jgi:CRP/FNR family cyclic AMP-dependent transcriptional regulator